ncbi:MAG: hypothetical protein DHS20C16_13660 [Phycisphaerae bacterium]|nr:MAG: hypothetical protein DHS20C16_13660 [Phycisphaerae bacterium]
MSVRTRLNTYARWVNSPALIQISARSVSQEVHKKSEPTLLFTESARPDLSQYKSNYEQSV